MKLEQLIILSVKRKPLKLKEYLFVKSKIIDLKNHLQFLRFRRSIKYIIPAGLFIIRKKLKL